MALLSSDYSKVLPIISSYYTVKDMQAHPKEDATRFLIAESDIGKTFPKFLDELSKSAMIATARRTNYESRLMPTISSTAVIAENAVIITVSKIAKTKPGGKNRVPVHLSLFFAAIIMILVDGVYRSNFVFAQAFLQDQLLIVGVYTMSLMGILGIHEMGHMIATKWHGIKASWPYFIPGVPGILPTFGAMIQIRSSMINRNVQFDVGIAGPIAGLLVAIIASVYGSSMSVLVPLDHAPLLLDGLQLIEMKSSIIMLAALQLTGNAGIGQDAVLIMSPVMFAAWFGFLITFLNLMPAWQLDGGHLVRAALGVHWHRILTYSSIGVLFGLQFYPMAMLVLILSMRSPESTPLDDVSKLSAKRKALFWVAIALAVLCAPVFDSAMYAPLPTGLFSFLP